MLLFKCFLENLLVTICVIHQIRQVFETYGNVTEIILPKDKMTGDRAGDIFFVSQLLEKHFLSLIFLLLGFRRFLTTFFMFLCSLLFC